MNSAKKLEFPNLQHLIHSHPLPHGGQLLDQFEEICEINGLKIHLSGLVGKLNDGIEATGSAADLRSFPRDRSYFELLERSYLQFAEISKDSVFPLRDSEGSVIELVPHHRVFSQPNSSQLVPARSNGLALHETWEKAQRSAHFELVERDRLLRSWRGELLPQKLPWNPDFFDALSPLYEISAYSFSDFTDQTQVCGLFAFPKDQQHPRVYGTAAAPNREEALGKASREFLQGLGFLWGESIPNSQPEPAANPQYHMDYYLFPRNHRTIRNWLDGKRMRSQKSPPRQTIDFVDLLLKGPQNVFLAKAVSTQCLPLIFGKPEEGEPHPFS